MNIKLLLCLYHYVSGYSDYTEYEAFEDEIPRQNITVSEDLFEGDIILTNEDNYDFPYLRNMVRNRSQLWPGGIVPYVLRGPLTARQEREVYRSIEDFHKNTCIRYN